MEGEDDEERRIKRAKRGVFTKAYKEPKPATETIKKEVKKEAEIEKIDLSGSPSTSNAAGKQIIKIKVQ